jgi:SAM-dependent methyltransferase
LSSDALRGRFERLYADDLDPWRYGSSRYEDEKYERTLSALPQARMGRALEMGCSIGVLTQRLARRCDELVAVDISEAAVEAARKRLGAATNVRLIRADLRERIPSGPFDLVVCSEILYYWHRQEVIAALERIEDELAPGGSLLTVNWRGVDPEAPMSGEGVHELLRFRPRLRLELSEVRTGYRLERWELRR